VPQSTLYSHGNNCVSDRDRVYMWRLPLPQPAFCAWRFFSLFIYSRKTCTTNVSMEGKEKENMRRKGNSVVLARWQADHR